MFHTGAGLATEEPDAVSFGRVCTGSTLSLGVLLPYFSCNWSPAHPDFQYDVWRSAISFMKIQNASRLSGL
jgi:hypothetical protein